MEYLSAFDDKQVDGVILVATVFSAAYKRILKNLSVPVVIVGQQLSGYCCVFHDDYHASYDLTELLLKKGRNSLGYIGAIQQDKAVGAVQYLQEHGIRIPEQILVAGKGDSDMSKVTSPPLITVHYSYEKSGELAIQMLMELLEQKETAVKEVKLGYYLVDPDPAI